MPITIDAHTPLSQLHSEYQRCCGYDLDNSVADARQFLRVCRALLSPRFPQEAELGNKQANSRQVISTDQLEKQLTACQNWLQQNDTSYRGNQSGGGVIYASNAGGFDR